MHLRHLFSSRLRGSLLLGSLLVVSSFSTQAAEEMLRKAVGKGAYEMAYSQQENALWLATSQSRKLDKGGVVYRLDPVTLEVTQAIHNDLKPFGATINNTTQTLWFGNTVVPMMRRLWAPAPVASIIGRTPIMNDPAVVSAPFIATLIDGTGLIIYFKIAQYFLGLN